MIQVELNLRELSDRCRSVHDSSDPMTALNLPSVPSDAKVSNDPIGFGHVTPDLLNQGRKHLFHWAVDFISPPPGAVPQPWRAG